MPALLRSDRGRIVLLNATLVFLFACAWVSDRWPELALPVTISAFVVVVGEAILIYRLARRFTSPDASQAASNIPVPKLVESYDVHHDDDLFTKVTIPKEYEKLLALHRHRLHSYAVRARASRASTWALAALRDDELSYRVIVRKIEAALAMQLELRRPLRSELAKWKVVTHGDEAFRIVAGAFEIEYFHGLTNIRVLDSSRVTIEGETRGVKSKAAPHGIRPPVYQ
jgi:hypothetical protein